MMNLIYRLNQNTKGLIPVFAPLRLCEQLNSHKDTKTLHKVRQNVLYVSASRYARVLLIVLMVFFSLTAKTQNKTINISPKVNFLSKGIEYYSHDSLDKAIQMFDFAIKIDSAYAEAYYRRGNAYFDKKDFNKAGHDYQWLIMHRTKIADVYEKAGQIDTLIHKYSQAIPFFTEAIALDSTQSSYFAARGISWFNLEQYGKADTDLQRAVDMNFVSADIYSRLGYAMLRTDDNKGAVFYFSKAIEMNPNNYEDYANRGDALVALHQLDAAKSDLYFYLKYDKSDCSVWYNLARAQYGLNEYDSAILSYKMVLKIRPGFGDTYFRMGLTYADKNEFQNAVDAFTNAIAQEPQGAYLYYNRALARARLHDGSDYCADLQKAKEMGFEQAARMMEKVCR